eukprot:CAMPEP_0182424046 /NCGR_PEP_ID=MMETSP1167-20130531/10190_1 /TAXON_ID=2988 /ORGANISM="Mallomonas Sp, Strain CCMP3275" /LENGTH=206 /DNA_ID=CAMNT_0024603545 /DNA_START=140 /DNA_END=760 /DNA_ORIENTATION=-
MTSNKPQVEQINDEQICIELLASMGIKNYDAVVVRALSQYMRRHAAEILCSAKSYSNMAQKPEIDVLDVIRAIETHDATSAQRLEARGNEMQELQKEINSCPLPSIPDTEEKRLPSWGLVARNYSFIPGWEAYPEPKPIIAQTSSEGGRTVTKFARTGSFSSSKKKAEDRITINYLTTKSSAPVSTVSETSTSIEHTESTEDSTTV